VEATLPSPLDGKLSLDEVTVALGFGFEPRAIAATGGRLEMRSDVLALEEALRSRRSGESESEASTSAPLPIEISNLVVDWRGVLPGLVESEVQVNGLELSRHSETLALSVASVTAKLPGLSAEMTELRCQLSRGEPGYALSRFEVRTSRLLVDASEVGRTTEALAAVLGRDGASPEPGSPPVPSEEPGPNLPEAAPAPAQAAPTGDSEDVEPPASNAGDDAVAAPSGASGPLNLGPLINPLRARLRGLRDSVLVRMRPGTQDVVESLALELRGGDQKLSLGPARVALGVEDSRVVARLTPSEHASTETFALAVTLPGDAAPLGFRAEGGPFPLALLGVEEGDFGLKGVDATNLEIDVTLELPWEGGELDFSLKGAVGPWQMQHAALSEEALTGRPVSGLLRGKAALDGSSFQVDDFQLGLGRARATAHGTLEKMDEGVAFDIAFDIPQVSCQELLDAIPGALIPLVRDVKMRGTFQWTGHLKGRSDKPKKLDITWNLSNECRITTVPENISPERFAAPFRYEIVDAEGLPAWRESGPSTSNWVPLGEISRHMETGLIVCEDSRFWSHDGFDQKALREAIVANLAAGRFVRGASTISMQLA
jgi:hypothetical protein